jgi:3-methyl-2-oxobutanoate hydroxymethyltransferase
MKPVTIHTLRQMKERGERITMLTAYDATFAHLLDGAGVDVLLVGDSLGMVVQGHDSTLPVTVDEMVYHCRAVRRGTKRAHVVGDLPFMSYQASVDEAVRNAGRLVAEGGAQSVKLEGGAEFSDVVSRIVRAGIPVMGHIGLTPQSVHKMGGYVVQGKDEEKARKLLSDALALEAAGCYAMVLEGIPTELATEITRHLGIPTIGIGAGVNCDGQVLVCYDLLGFNPDFAPKFVKRFADGAGMVQGAAKAYIDEVRGAAFPADEHSFHSKTLRLYPASVKPAGGPGSPESDDDAIARIYAAPV